MKMTEEGMKMTLPPTARPARRRRNFGSGLQHEHDELAGRDKSDYHLRKKTATEYDRKPGVKRLSCIVK
jgi:hypothetical protein